MNRIVLAALLILALAIGARGAEAQSSGFLKEGDVWVFHGDSITHADTYRRLCERVFRHYHPEAKVAFLQAGVWGSSSSDAAAQLKAEGRKPTVVSLMTGMNNAINGGWVKGMPRDKVLAAYRKDLAAFVRKNRADGAAVILMSPTLTDENCRRTFFRIAGATDLLRDFRAVVEAVAREEGAFYVPVQEEFEAFQESLGPKQRLRPDGVHPASLGEYAIARTLWEHLNFAGSVDAGERRLAAPRPAADLALVAAARRVEPGVKTLDFVIVPPTNPAVERVAVTWSLGALRKTEEVAVTGRTAWALALESGLPPLKDGESSEAVVELRAGQESALFVVDLGAVPVFHFSSNLLAGVVDSVEARPEGGRVCAWRLERRGGELLGEFEVADGQIHSAGDWAYARDGLNVFLDLRPAERVGDINVDDDVHQLMINFYEQPFVAAALRPWLGGGLDNAAVCGGEKTATGYRLRLRLGDRLNLQEPFALDRREWLGLSLAVTDADLDEGGKARVVLNESFTAARARDQYASGLALIDLKDRWPSDRALNVHVFPAAGAGGR